jgi:hypothetical protein
VEKISWAPKVGRTKVWRLYQNDAIGAIDDALVVDVGFSLWLRCKSVVMVTLFQVECPRCRQVFDVGRMEGSEPIACPTPGCGWQITGEEYHWDLKENAPNRSVGNNLIEGSHIQVIALLDKLSFGESGIDKEHWRETVDTMMRRRRGGEPAI